LAGHNSLRNRATYGLLWSAIDKVGVRLVQFVFGVILARILVPADFGLVGMLTIFIGISQSFIDSGMGAGLIQKQDRTNADYSTVFVFNLVVSALVYSVLFVAAPFIAAFYELPELTLLTRVLTINFLIGALAIVQRNKLTIALDFKGHTKVNISASLIGGGVGIWMAYHGYGVWALVGQTLSGSVVSLGVLWWLSHWRPSLYFSKKSFQRLFGYGSKLMFASVYAQFMQEIYNIIIGKAYSAATLGFYTRARSFTQIAADSITTVINQVSFPLLSSLQHEQERMLSIYRRMIRMAAFLMIPTMVTIAVLAEPIVMLLLTEKWSAVIPLLQWMVFARIFYPMSAINLNLLKAVGRSDWFMWVDMSKFPVLLLSLVITVPMGIKAMVIGQVITSFIAFLINTYLPGKHFQYGAWRQLKDMAPMAAMAICMAGVTFVTIYAIESYIWQLVVGGVVSVVIYLGCALLFKVNELSALIEVGRQLIQKSK
jgi:teichuronic acid exporter